METLRPQNQIKKTTSRRRNSLLTYLKLSHRISRRSLPAYSNKYSKRKFSQPQVMACLLLREYLKLDLRALEELIASNPVFLKVLKLKQAPDHSTFCRHLARTSPEAMQRLLEKTVRLLPKAHREDLAAIDSTGISSSHASLYYFSKTKKHLKGFAKLSCVAGLSSLLVLSARVHAGPGPNDRVDFLPLVAKAHYQVPFKTILADKGYDSEKLHAYCRNFYKVTSIIPTILPKDRVKTGFYRLQMAKRFPRKIYRQRYKIEGVFSALKRKFGGFLKSRSSKAQLNEALLKTVAYNIHR